MQCQNCGFENIPGQPRCTRCQSLLSLTRVDVYPPRRAQRRWPASLRFLARRLLWLTQRAPRLHLQAMLDYLFVPDESQQFRPMRIRWLLVPGLGMIPHRRRAFGWCLLLGWVAALGGAVLWAGTRWGPWLLMATVSIHASSILSLNLGRASQSFRARLGIGLLTFAIVWVLVYWPARAIVSRVVTALPIQAVAPTVQAKNGDVLLSTGTWLRPAKYRRGDLVVYRIQGSTFHAGPANYRVRSGMGVDRIVGLPGDHVEVRDGVLLVNGGQPPPGQRPLLDAGSLTTLNLKLGSSEYMIFPSTLFLDQYRPQAQADPLIAAVSVVQRDRIVGRVFWRSHPFGRFGPVN